MAVITRSIERDGNLAPCAVNFLEQIPAQALFNIEHRLRHPASIYKLSLEKIAKAFCQVVEEYESKTAENREYSSATLNMDRLLENQVTLLHALQEHVDELWMILKTLADPKLATKFRVFNERYVLDNNVPGARSFRDAIADYRKQLVIVNKLKHQQCFLRGVAVWSNSGVHLGYCLEEPDAKGALGPSPEIHPSQGAFSFARDLTWHLAQVYLCSEKLKSAAQRTLSSRGFLIKDKIKSAGPDWKKVLSAISKVPPAIFPKESKKPMAHFDIDTVSQMLRIKIPYHVEVRFPSSINVRYSTVLDGHNTNHRVPFP